MTIYLAPLLHAYQPPTQEITILKEISEESYKPVLSIIDEFELSRFSLNINGILIEMLKDYGLYDTVEFIKNLYAKEKIEILGTAKYHPILPLIPEGEVIRQIKLNEQLNKKVFGKKWKKCGFFPPEMAISKSTLRIIKELGYQWVILSGVALPMEKEGVYWPNNHVYTSLNGLNIFFRDDILSNKIAFNHTNAENFFQAIKKLKKNQEITSHNNIYVILALDFETFGHHIKKYEFTFLKSLMELISGDSKIQLVSISELSKYFPIKTLPILPKDSSWSTTYEDLSKNIPFPLWKHPENDIHHFYWKIMRSLNQLMQLADKLNLVKASWEIRNYYTTARYFYDRSLYSCPPWWGNQLRGMFSPNLIYKGLELIMKAALNAQLALEYAGVQSGEGYFDSISYYQGLLLMELYSVARKALNNRGN